LKDVIGGRGFGFYQRDLHIDSTGVGGGRQAAETTVVGKAVWRAAIRIQASEGFEKVLHITGLEGERC
jgi:hypothetical protein